MFDIEVDRTHNFVANGLVTHNTRWHMDDLLGRLASREYSGNPDDWEIIEFPAIAEKNDALGREPGDPLLIPLLEETRDEAVARWNDVKQSVGRYMFSALYQQRPSPAKGAIFDIGSFKFWTLNPDHDPDDMNVTVLDPAGFPSGTWVDSWDLAFKALDTSDYVVGQRWVKIGPNRYLMHQFRGRETFTQTVNVMLRWCNPHLTPYARYVHKRLVEEKANGSAVIDVLNEKVSGIKPINPKDSKESRMWSVTPEVESGHVLLPYPGDPGNDWVLDLISELREAPNGSHDDQVDALTQALTELRDPGIGLVTVPGGRAQKRPTEINRSRSAAATTYRRNIR